jgi:serine O-acetyltransferase
MRWAVVGETAEIGDGCTIYQGVTLGGMRALATPSATQRWARTCGWGWGPGASFTVGDGAKIGSNAVVVKPVPAGATAVATRPA